MEGINTSEIIKSVAKLQLDPSPPFEGWILLPPRPESLPSFVHTPLNEATDERRLLVLVPHNGNASSPIQCGLVHAPIDSHQCYTFVINSSLGNPRATSLILVNGRAFRVTRALELFLRCLRDAEYGRLLFIHEICADTSDATINNQNPPQWFEKFQKEETYIVGKACGWIDTYDFLEPLNDEDVSKSSQATLDENQDVISSIPCPRCQSRISRNLSLRLYLYEPAHLGTKRPGYPVYKPLDRTLVHVPLRAKAGYDALSYTWGDRADVRTLIINAHPFDVTANLYSALLHMRRARKFVPIWVDAICINQEDIVEKNRQVRRMGDVYKETISTKIWLGSAENNSDLAMTKIAQIYEPCERDWKAGCADDHETPDPQENLAWEAIYQLLSRPWFKRTWVVQEVVLGAGSLICHGWVACGSQRTSWAAICHASRFIASRQERNHMVFKVDDPETHFFRSFTLEIFRQMRCSGASIHLLPVMIAYQKTQSTDPRDKIYGFHGIADDAADLITTPDYAHSVEYIYTSFVVAYIKKYSRLDVICAAQGGLPGDIIRLPNWVPNWSSNAALNPFLYSLQKFLFLRFDTTGKQKEEIYHYRDEPLYRAAGTSRSIVRFAQNASKDVAGLIVVGLSCDTVERVGDLKFVIPARPRNEWKTMMMEVHESLGDKQPYLDQEDAFWRIMVAGRTPWEEIAPDDLTFLENVWPETDSSVDHTQGPQWRFYTSEILKRRNFIVTKQGYIGLSHHVCEKGTKVFILLGCSVPVILRKISYSYLFLRDCYVQGWMNGEMLEAAGGDQAVYNGVKDKGTEYLDSCFHASIQEPSDEEIEDATVPRVFLIH